MTMVEDVGNSDIHKRADRTSSLIRGNKNQLGGRGVGKLKT